MGQNYLSFIQMIYLYMEKKTGEDIETLEHHYQFPREECHPLCAPRPVPFDRVAAANFELPASKILATLRAHSCVEFGKVNLWNLQSFQHLWGFLKWVVPPNNPF